MRRIIPKVGGCRPGNSTYSDCLFFNITDLLQNVAALAGPMDGSTPHLANALDLVWQKQADQGRWALEFDYAGKIWTDFGSKKLPNKWVTLRALNVLMV